jgi:hypothetical protein
MANPNYDDDKKNMDTQPSVTEQIREYIMENLLSVIWSASLLVGGLIFWLYFFQIQYFPDLTFDESVLLLLLATFTGIFFLLLMATLLMTPYFFRWIMLTAYHYDSGFDETDRQKWRLGELVWYFISIYLAIVAISLNASKEVKFDFSKSYYMVCWIFENSEYVILALSIVVLIGHILCYLGETIWNFIRKCLCQFTSKKNDKAKKRKKDETKGEDNLGKLVVLWGWLLSVLTSFVPLIILIAIEAQTESFDDTNLIILLAGFYFLVMMINGIYAYFQEQAKKRKWWYYSIPLLGLLVIFYLAGEPIIPKLVMKKFHLGSFTAEQLILDKEGCKLLRSMGLKPMPIKDKNDNDLKECYLKKICILSRLGHVFALEKKVESKKFNFYIPKDHVLSWRIIKKEKADKESTETCPIR